jgi:alpha-tubulin suppressor-like RCC1 family protein
MALKSNGTIYTCGNNLFGQLGDGTTNNSPTPVAVALPGGASAVAIAANEYHSLALTSGGAVFAWGHNAFGQLGNGTTTDSSRPVAVAVPGTVTQIAAGWAFDLALTSSGAVYAWGYNGNGELGTTSVDTCATFYPCAKTPVAVNLVGATVKAIAAGWDHALAIRSDNTVLAWGLNNYGQLGDGTTTNRLVPTPAIGGLAVKAIACGGAHSLAIKMSDSTGLAWGLNNRGQLGDGTTINRLSPVTPLAPADANVTGISGGWAHSLFVK